jgi:hypothetical protein
VYFHHRSHSAGCFGCRDASGLLLTLLLTGLWLLLLLLLLQESLGTIEATVQAALDAEMPPSCKRTVYLCDDGKDKEKKACVDTLAHSGYCVE